MGCEEEVRLARFLSANRWHSWPRIQDLALVATIAWAAMAAQCDETAHLTAGERKARSSAKLVHPDRLADAAARYMDYEALAYWARPALERHAELPAEVVREMERRCPGYLDAEQQHQERRPEVLHETGST